MDKEVLLSNPKGFCTEKYIRIHFPEDFEKIQKCEGRCFSERLYNYWYNNGIAKRCITCNENFANFHGILRGYSDYCSQKCSTSNELRTNKIRQTLYEKYGVTNASQADIVKEKKKQTLIEHFGGVGFGSKIISNTIQQTVYEKYGVTNASQADIVKEKKEQTMVEHFGKDARKIISQKTKQTMLCKYGVETILQLDHVKQKAKENYYNKCHKHKDYIINISNTDPIYYMCRCNHEECNQCVDKTFEIRNAIYRDRLRLGIELCTKLLPEQSLTSTMEVFIRKILDNYGIDYVTNTRSVISPKELDIYIPSYKLAIECNGVYWHNSNKKEANYHYYKFKACQEQGIQLLTFWEDQYHNKPKIIESIIRSKLGIYDHTIGARKCSLRVISYQESSSFINTYHIQGSTNSKIRIGLFYKDELVSVMTFSHRKGGQGKGEVNWVLDRYCVKSGYKISGGASKLLNYFIKTYCPHDITSFASNDISNGNLYKQLGFQQSTVSIGYWYIDSVFKRYHRSNFMKSAIVRKGWKDKIDNTWTENEVMYEHGFNKIYDSGTTKYILTL